MSGDRFTQSLFDCRDKALVGGKAANLGTMLRGGFPVPDGFVVNTRAYRFARERRAGDQAAAGSLPAEVALEIRRAYQLMGGGPVAVRSSATAEDMAAASMAGQYETFLDIDGDVDLLEAVARCWGSIDGARVRAYLCEHGIDPSDVAMAVVVQRLVKAEVAGVLFTANPQSGSRGEMLLEASWGLGESVVSGRVQPDVLRLERDTGRVLAATIADKRVELTAGVHAERPVAEDRRRRACLRAADVLRLWEMGRRVVEHFGAPQDIEWALCDGDLFMLQSRPITTLEEAEAQEDVLRETRSCLRESLAAGRGPWVLHNLAETLPHPTPLTWSVLQRFMSGAGGFGAMYRRAGFEPSPMACREGFLERVAGRVYMDASRAPEMFFENFPFAYDLEELKRSPDASQTPPTLPRGSFTARMSAARRLGAVGRNLQEASKNLDQELSGQTFPQFAKWVADEKQKELRQLSSGQLIDLWEERERRILDEFAPLSLLPSLISGMALSELRMFVAENFWKEDPDHLSQLISSGGPPNRTLTADANLHDVALGTRSVESWLAEHGHRAGGEFDLASPRWREQPAAVLDMARRLKEGEGPLERHHRQTTLVGERLAAMRAKLSATEAAEMDRRVGVVRRYVSFREDGKDFLMLGYDLLRDLALEAGARLEIGQDVFCLRREDLFDALRVSFAPLHLIARRKAAYAAEKRIWLPRVIDADAIEKLGEPPRLSVSAGGYKAFALSSGSAAGPARIVHSPAEAGELGRGYILICPSTDPSWTPLFVHASGLVLECGGTLSHGAVVAREMGLPAVVLPDATRLFHAGDVVRVDATRGHVGIASEQDNAENSADLLDPKDIHVSHDRVPPPPGRKDRTAARWRNLLAAGWGVYLLAAFLLPERWLYRPSLTLLDAALWPLARDLGRPAVVALVAGGIAALTLVLQKLLTDNERLLEAKRRAALLNAEAARLPKGSPAARALSRLAGPVQWRTLAAAMAPVGLLLGPMVMTFVWLGERLDPNATVFPPGAAVQVMATVDSDLREPVELIIPAPLSIDEATPPAQTLPPIKETLIGLKSLYEVPRQTSEKDPPELRIAPDFGRMNAAADLQAFLDAGVPPQGIAWTVRAPAATRGRIPLRVTTKNRPPVDMNIVLGDQLAPAPTSVEGGAASPIRRVSLSYAGPKSEPVFWRPLRRFETWNHVPLASKLAHWDIGWLWLYVACYVPVLLALRWALKIA